MARKKKGTEPLSTNVIVQKLATHYRVMKPFTDGVDYDYLVHEQGTGLKFIFGLFTVGDDRVVFNNDIYSTEKELLEAVKAYNDDLMFPPHTYDPSMPGTTRTELQINWYLRQVLGYELSKYDADLYVKRNLYGQVQSKISYKVDEAPFPNNGTSGTISMYVSDTNFYHSKFENAEEAVKSVNALAYPGTVGVLTDSMKMLETMHKYGFDYNSAIDIKMNGFQIDSISKVKDTVIQQLEDMLTQLKGC
jgi:hypothetical protein